MDFLRFYTWHGRSFNGGFFTWIFLVTVFSLVLSPSQHALKISSQTLVVASTSEVIPLKMFVCIDLEGPLQAVYLCLSYISPTILLQFSEVLDTLSWVSCATLRRLHVRFQQTSIMMPPPCGSHLPRFGFFLVGIEVVIGLAGFQQLINTCFCRFFKDSRCIDLFTVCVCVLLQRLVQDQVILGSLQWRGTSFQDVYNINDLSTTQYQNQNPPSWEVQVACETTWS